MVEDVPVEWFGIAVRRAMSDGSSASGSSLRMDLRNVQAKGQAHVHEMILGTKEWSQMIRTWTRLALDQKAQVDSGWVWSCSVEMEATLAEVGLGGH